MLNQQVNCIACWSHVGVPTYVYFNLDDSTILSPYLPESRFSNFFGTFFVFFGLIGPFSRSFVAESQLSKANDLSIDPRPLDK